MDASEIILKLGFGGVTFVLTMALIYSVRDYLKRSGRSEKTGPAAANLSALVLEEKRQYERADITYPVKIETSQGTIEAETKNISLGGAFICCHKPLPLGENFSLTINASDHLPLTLKAEVVWSNVNVPDDKVVNRGMGIRFLQITADDREVLENVISANLMNIEE